MFSDSELYLVSEEEDSEDYVLTFKASERVVKLLKSQYGDNYEEHFSKLVGERLKEFVEANKCKTL